MRALYLTKNNVRRGFTKNLDERIKYFNLGKIYTVEVKLTPKCSFRCNYCYAESTPTCNQQLSMEKLKELIDDCIESDVKQINWGGGEPLERKGWYEIMKYAKSKGLTNLLMTNGMMLHKKDIVKKVSDVVEMAFVHIDTLNKDVWESLHETKSELHKMQVDGLTNLLDNGFPRENLAISMTTAKPLFENDDYKKTIDWAYDKLGIAVILFPYRNFGFAEKRVDYNPSFEQLAEIYQYRNNKDGIPSGPGFGTKFYCGTKCYIQSGGEVLGCSMVYPTYVGNVNKERFKDIYEKNWKTLSYYHLHNPSNIKGHCSDCENNSFCWGCRAAAALITGDHNNADPLCWMEGNCKNS